MKVIRVSDVVAFFCKDCEYNSGEGYKDCSEDSQLPDYCPQEKILAKLDLLEKGGVEYEQGVNRKSKRVCRL